MLCKEWSSEDEVLLFFFALSADTWVNSDGVFNKTVFDPNVITVVVVSLKVETRVWPLSEFYVDVWRLSNV
jgi:hypothetical protein